MASGLPGRRIKHHRTSQQMSQAELARRAHTTVASISRIENNRQNYTRDLLEQLAQVLGVTVTDLFRSLEDQPAGWLLSPTQEELLRFSSQLEERVVSQILLLLRLLVETAPPSSAGGVGPWTAWLSCQGQKTLKYPVAE